MKVISIKGNRKLIKGHVYETDFFNNDQNQTSNNYRYSYKRISIKDRGYYKGENINPEAASAWIKLDKTISSWKKLKPKEFHTVEGLDKLKQKIGSIQQSLEYGTPARSAADSVYNAIKAEIVKQAPDYAKVMAGYESTIQHLRDLERELSTGNKSSAATTARKLQAGLRNNANTGWGARTNMMRELEAAGAETLFPALAGQALSPAFARGLPGNVVGGAAAYNALTNVSDFDPVKLALSAALAGATSPRVVGEAAYYAGRAASPIKMAAKPISRVTKQMRASGVTPKNVNKATLLAQILAQQNQQEEPQ